MIVALACYGTRGDVEPGVALGCELLRRGHDVRMAVPPDQVEFTESAGLSAVAYGLDMKAIAVAQRKYWTCLLRNPWRIGELNTVGREVAQLATQCWEKMTATLMSLADGADILISGLNLETPVANVAEYYDIPFAALHFFPIRVHGRLLPFLPTPVSRSAMKVYEWVAWLGTKKLEDVQRRQLSLQKASCPSPRRIAQKRSLEIQAYDQVCYPGLAEEWAKWEGQRPFVGALTMELPTDSDVEVATWLSGGTPPIYFGFGSIPAEAAAETLAIISAACARLGERALICSGGTDFSEVSYDDHVKVVPTVNHAAVFPACRAVVHHGGAGTTAAGLRAGVPTLILWMLGDQPFWGVAVKRLKVGTARRLSTITLEMLVADLRTILTPQYAARARELAVRMTEPAVSVAAAADHLEHFARLRGVGNPRGEPSG